MGALVVVAVGCVPQRPAATAGSAAIRQIGSTTVLPLAQKWQEGFNAEHPEIEIAISGGGSGIGIEALISGSAEIANASRPMKDEEKQRAWAAGVEPVEHVVAYDGLAVVVHPANPLSELTFEQVAGIFARTIQQWDKVGAAGLGETVVISRDSSSGTWAAFKKIVLAGREYAPEALAVSSNQAIIDLVARYPPTIGYVSLSYLDDSVKTLKVTATPGDDAIEPSVGNVQNGSYPVSRALYCYTKGKPTGEVGEYVQWIKGPAGQAIVAELGYVPVPE